jgi:hypothetical protein
MEGSLIDEQGVDPQNNLFFSLELDRCRLHLQSLDCDETTTKQDLHAEYWPESVRLSLAET